MCEITINIPNEVLYDTRMSKQDAAAFARRTFALFLYAHNGVSLGYCAQIAEMPKEDFIRYLSNNHISIFHFDDKEEFLEELRNA